MTSEQLSIWKRIINDAQATSIQSSNNSSSGLHQQYLIEGKAGRGKSFLDHALCSHFRGIGQIVVIAGTTALSASILYERGRTAHSVFGIPISEVCL